MDKFYERLVGKEPSVFVTIQAPTIESEYVIVEYVQAHIKIGTLALVYSNPEHANEAESMLRKYGIATSRNMTLTPTRGIVYILPINEAIKVMYDSSILYLFRNVDYINGCLKFASRDRLVVVDTEIVFPIDRIVFYQQRQMEDGYELYKLGFLKYMVKYFTDLFSDNESLVGTLFTKPNILMDGKFMGYIVRLQSFSYSYLYETFRMTQNRNMILRFLEAHLIDLLTEVQKKARFHLTTLLLQDFNYSIILNLCHQNNLTIFSYLTPVQKEDLFKRISSDIGQVINAIDLKIWNYSTIYKYSINNDMKIGKEFLEYNLEGLIKEVDFNCDFGILPNIINDFDNSKVIDIAYQINTKMFINIQDELKEQIFLNTCENKETLLKCIKLHIWTYRMLYTYSIKHVCDSYVFTEFLNEHIKELILEIIENRDYAIAAHLQNDFALLDVVDVSRKIAVLFDTPTRKELYMQLADKSEYLRECFALDVWPILDMYHYYIELGRTSKETHAIIEENLSLLFDKIESSGDYRLVEELLNDFEPKEILIVVKKIGSGILVSMNEESKKKFLLASVNDEESLKAGLDLDLWPAMEVYRYGLDNPESHDVIVKCLGTCLRKIIMETNSSIPEEVLHKIIEDFDVAALFKEAKEYGENIFKNISNAIKEKIIIGISEDDKLLEWGLEKNVFSEQFLLEVVGKNKLKMTKYARYHIGDLLFETDDKELLARLIIEADVEEEAMNIFKKKFKVFLAKDIKVKINSLRSQGVIKDNILGGEEIKQTAMDNLLNSSSMSKKEEKRLEKEEKRLEKEKKDNPVKNPVEEKQLETTGKRLMDNDLSEDDLLGLLDEVDSEIK